MFSPQPSEPQEGRLSGIDMRRVQAPYPANLRIIDGSEGRVEALVVRGRAFQSQTEDIGVPSVDITCMCCIHFLHAHIIIFTYDYMIVCVALCSVYISLHLGIIISL